jgi:hypothetical protein
MLEEDLRTLGQVLARLSKNRGFAPRGREGSQTAQREPGKPPGRQPGFPGRSSDGPGVPPAHPARRSPAGWLPADPRRGQRLWMLSVQRLPLRFSVAGGTTPRPGDPNSASAAGTSGFAGPDRTDRGIRDGRSDWIRDLRALDCRARRGGRLPSGEGAGETHRDSVPMREVTAVAHGRVWHTLQAA